MNEPTFSTKGTGGCCCDTCDGTGSGTGCPACGQPCYHCDGTGLEDDGEECWVGCPVQITGTTAPQTATTDHT